MKRLLLLVSCLLYVCSLVAQQEPLFSQYRTNVFMINPAAAGSGDNHQLRLNFRSQWRRFPGAPRTVTLSYNGKVDEKSAIGLMAFNDAVGPTQRTGLQFAYAFHIPLSAEEEEGEMKLSFGMAGKLIQHSFRADQVYFQDRTDVAIFEASEGALLGDLSFGAYLYSDRFFAGASVPNLIQSDLGSAPGVASQDILSRLYRHYFAFVGYRFEYEDFSVEPSVLMKKVENVPFQIEGNIKFFFVDDKMFLGFSYRTDWLMTLMCGFNAKGVHFIYSADIMSATNNAASVYGASHEFTVGFDFGGGNESSGGGGRSKGWKKYYTD